jgi:hypothetical protein
MSVCEQQMALPLGPVSTGFHITDLTESVSCFLGYFDEQFDGTTSEVELEGGSLSDGFFGALERFKDCRTPTQLHGLDIWVLGNMDTSEGIVLWTPDGIVSLTAYNRFTAIPLHRGDDDYLEYVQKLVAKDTDYTNQKIGELLNNAHHALISPNKVPMHWRISK